MLICNPNADALDQLLDGMLAAHPGKFETLPNLYSHTLLKKELRENRVQIIVSGGGGYGPLFAGLVGDGLADAMLEGDFDCAPNAYALYETAKRIERGRGVLFMTNNFTGDFLNNDMAQELLRTENIDSKVCYFSDDLFSARGEPKEKRGGLCGGLLLLKIASAAADAGLSLEEVFRVVEKANDRLRSVTVCLNEKDGTMEFGAGFSGEAPAEVLPYRSADDLIEHTLGFILGELASVQGGRAHFMVNRMKAMSYLEGYLLLDATHRRLQALGLLIGHSAAGCYFDAFPANGCILSVLFADDELERYLVPVAASDFSI